MAGTTDINIVLGQGNIIKEIQNVKRQDLDLNQQLVAQQTKDEREEEKSRVQEFEAENKIGLETDEEKGNRGDLKGRQDGSKRRKKDDEDDTPDGNIIDIKV